MSSKVLTPQIDIDDVVNCTKHSVRIARNEEEVRVRVSRCIEDKVLKPLGVTQYGHYEYTLVSGARVDALYGHVVVKYKAPGKLTSASDIARAKEQVVRYITKEAPTKAEWDRYLGVIISDRIAFVKYYKPQDTWILRGPYDITRESVIKLIEAIRGLRRKALKVETLLEEFGPESDVARKAVARLYVINATFLGGPALAVWRGGVLVVVLGAVGTLEAGVSVQVYGVSSSTYYTVVTELVLPNGTAIPLNIHWWTPNPPEAGIICGSTNTYNLSPMKLSGSTLRITIQELNLTVAIRIPR